MKQKIRYYTIKELEQKQNIALKIKAYKPKLKVFFLGLTILLIGFCIVTPFTNMFIPLIVKYIGVKI